MVVACAIPSLLMSLIVMFWNMGSPHEEAPLYDEAVREKGVVISAHIAETADWEQAQRDGQYTMSTRGRTLAEEGFIHASTAAQVPLVAAAYYRDAPDLVLLVIDTERVGPELRYEQVPGQPDPYPHIYGPLNLSAVLETRPFQAPNP